jgi:hypothetical protein
MCLIAIFEDCQINIKPNTVSEEKLRILLGRLRNDEVHTGVWVSVWPATRTPHEAELVEKSRAAGQVPFARPKRFEALSAGVMVYSIRLPSVAEGRNVSHDGCNLDLRQPPGRL